jgi:hypothetical protein
MKITITRDMRPATVDVKQPNEHIRFATMLYAWSILFAISAMGLQMYLGELKFDFLPMMIIGMSFISVLASVWGVLVNAIAKSRSQVLAILGFLGPVGWMIMAGVPEKVTVPSRQFNRIR